jgi:hypothetical protein
MGKKLVIVAALVALMAAPAFAAVQNVKVGGALTTTSILDTNVVSGGTSSDQRGSDILAQTQLDVSADLTDMVSTKIGLLNERLWGNTSDSESGTSIDLETAYVTMKEFLYSPLTLTVGRQPLSYGNELIIGSNTFSSTLPSVYQDLSKKGNFDAVKAVLGYDALTVDLFAARLDTNDTYIAAGGNADNINLYGVNTNFKLGDKMGSVVEAYVFAKIDDTIRDYNNSSAADDVKSQYTYVPGLRVSMNPIEGMSLQLEGAYQTGRVNNGTQQQVRDAYAFQAKSSLALKVLTEYSPVVSAEYKWLSGNMDRRATETGLTNEKIGRNWDPMFENQDKGRIFNALALANSNAQVAKLGLEATPMQDVTAALSWYGIWAAAKAQYIDGSVNSSMYKGSEVALDVAYAYTEDVKIGVSADYFLTGKKYLAPSGSNKNASQILSSVSVAF